MTYCTTSMKCATNTLNIGNNVKNKNFFSKIILMVILSFVLSGCISNPDDISNQQPYSSALGYRFESKIDLLAHGVNMEKNYKGGTQLISITPPPGFGGPEVEFKKIIPKNTTFIVKGVWTYRTNFYFTKVYIYLVEIEKNNEMSKYPITIELTEPFLSESKGLNKDYFKYLNN